MGTAPRPLASVFETMSLVAQALLGQMLRWDPETRITVNTAIENEYIDTLHCPDDEPIRDPLDTADFEFERRKVTVGAIREELFQETLQYYPGLLTKAKESGMNYDVSQYRLLVPGETLDSSDGSDDE